MILRGEFEVGEHVSEVALAERLDVSRTPLRQAMAKLVEEALLDRTGPARVAAERGVTEGEAAEGFEIEAG